ncbi:MAG: gamma-glutamyl-gamma-aminobutyrate hydrolase family protein [Proteobacteria bacterium]|nr:gamma-glutamyl-gamma-aminobutyrate hydrolase family protein [Pseudomonadota bacterium]
MTASASRPLVGISCCVKDLGSSPNHAASATYVRWLSLGAGLTPILIPALGPELDLDGLLAHLDGVVLTGSRTNVEPHHYQGPPSEPGTPHDPARDATTLPLVRATLARGLPLLAICRGFEEMNVALGGTLHQMLESLPGFLDHSTPSEQPVAVKFALAHFVDLVPGGYLAGLFGTARIAVNSLHHQGIDRPADGLAVEARAPDGLIEAARVVDAPAYALGIQWHPERRPLDDVHAARLFADFGDAVRRHAEARERPAARPEPRIRRAV